MPVLLKRRIVVISVFISLSFLMTGCFDIIEEVYFAKNGSGKARVKLDFTRVVNYLNTMDQKVISDFNFDSKKMEDSILTEIKNRISTIKGLSNVRTFITQNTFGLEFDFNNVQSLNHAMNKFFESDSKNKYYDFQNGKITRTGYAINDEWNVFRQKRFQTSEEAFIESLGRAVYSTASIGYKSIIYIPKHTSNIVKNTNGNAAVSLDGSAITIQSNLAAIAKDSTSIANTITY